MQAAELLAIIVPGTPGQAGAPGLANGVGQTVGGKAGAGKAGVSKPGEGLLADASASQGDGQGAEGINPFAQALAALMAAPGQGAIPGAVTPPPVTEGDAPPSDTPQKGLQTALAATTKAGAPAYGLVRLLADAGAPTAVTGAVAPQGEGTVPATANATAPGIVAKTAGTAPATADAASTTADTDSTTADTVPAIAPTIAPPIGQTAPTTADVVPAATDTGPPTAKTLPATANADEALARRLASPPPRSERADAVAKGPHLPPWASPPVPAAGAGTPGSVQIGAPQTSTPPVTDPQIADPQIADSKTPEVAAAQTQTESPAAATGDEPPPTLALAAAETGAQNSAKPAAPPRADGRALGKVDAKDKTGDETAPDHQAQGVGKGLATAPGQLKKTDSDETSTDSPAVDPKLAKADAPGAAEGSNPSIGDLAHAPAAADAPRGDPGRLAAHTVAHLAEQIVSKSEGKATRFDVQLDPAGLGKVDVRIEIGRGGEISAAMTFDNPAAAAEMRTRAGELRSALEQAGFDLGKGGLSFDFSGQNPGGNLWDRTTEPPRPSWAAAGAFTDLAALADTPSPARWRQIDADGVDVTV